MQALIKLHLSLILALLTANGFAENPQHGPPPHVVKKWEADNAVWKSQGHPGRVAVDVEKVTELAKMPDKWRSIEDWHGFWRTASPEELMVIMAYRDRGEAKTVLPEAWLSWDPNRPKSACVAEELVISNGTNWRQKVDTDTCASHALEAAVRHALYKRGVKLPEWAADELIGTGAAVGNLIEVVKKKRGVDFEYHELGPTSLLVKYPSTFIPVLQEAIKQELVKGRPVVFGAMVPGVSVSKKAGWVLTKNMPGRKTPHAMVMVGFEEDEAGNTTWKAWDAVGPEKTKGILTITDEFLNWHMGTTGYSIE